MGRWCWASAVACCRSLPIAEDAFQATWLTFVKKTGTIVHRATVGSWLYQVAYRVALRVRQTRAKRSEREPCHAHTLAVAPVDGIAESGELGRLLDEEINRPPTAHVERTRELEQMRTAFAKTGQGKVSDAAAATYERINAEIRYFEATGELLPTVPKEAQRQ